MGCQTKIGAVLCAAKADYVLALNGHQSTIHEEVEAFFEVAEDWTLPI